MASPFHRWRRGADIGRRGVRLYSLTPRGLAPRDGFEPSTQRLTAACSTTALPGIRARLATSVVPSKARYFAGVMPAAAHAPIGRRHIGQACGAPQACLAPHAPQNWTLPSEGGARRTGAGGGGWAGRAILGLGRIGGAVATGSGSAALGLGRPDFRTGDGSASG